MSPPNGLVGIMVAMVVGVLLAPYIVEKYKGGHMSPVVTVVLGVVALVIIILVTIQYYKKMKRKK